MPCQWQCSFDSNTSSFSQYLTKIMGAPSVLQVYFWRLGPPHLGLDLLPLKKRQVKQTLLQKKAGGLGRGTRGKCRAAPPSQSSVPWLKAAAITAALLCIKAQHSYLQEITYTSWVLVSFPAGSKFLPVLPRVEPGWTSVLCGVCSVKLGVINHSQSTTLNAPALVGSANIESLAYLLPWQSPLKLFLAYIKGTEKKKKNQKSISNVKYKEFKFKKNTPTFCIPSVRGPFTREPWVWWFWMIKLCSKSVLGGQGEKKWWA